MERNGAMNSRIQGRKATHAARRNTLLVTFQDALECLRRETGLTRHAFAERLGIPRSSYFHLMTESANPSLDYIEQIAVRAGIDPISFLCNVGGQNTRSLMRGER